MKYSKQIGYIIARNQSTEVIAYNSGGYELNMN